jgi:ketol-acid reductoisomerase
MFSSISNTAKYGGFTTGDFLINEGVKERMRQVLTKIKDGSFASSFMHEALEKNYQFKQEINAKFANSSLERAGQEVIHLLKNLK